MFSASLPLSAKFHPTPSFTASAATTRPLPRMSTSRSHYDVLGIQIGATLHEIKAAYRKLARAVHPDVRSDGHENASSEEFIKVYVAYSTLNDPSKRAEYDRGLFRRQTYSTGVPGYSRRSWETDQCW